MTTLNRTPAIRLGSALLLALPALCHAVDTTSTAYRNGRIAGLVVGFVLLTLVIKKLTGTGWLKSAALPVLAVGAWFVFSTGTAKARGLDKPMVEAFVLAGAEASSQRNAQALCGQLAEGAQVKLVTVRFSGSDVANYDKEKWCETLRHAFDALPSNVTIEETVDFQSIEVSADGQHAEVSYGVVETVAIAGQRVRQASTQQASVALVGGQPRYTALSARVLVGQ